MDHRFMTNRSISWVEFSVEMAGGLVRVKGAFNTYGSTIFYDEENPESFSATLIFHADSATAGSGELDAAVRSPAFLDAESHPRIVLQSTKAVPRTDGLDVVSELTVKGVTREVVVHLEPPSPIQHDDRSHFDVVSFRGHLRVDRGDFGITETNGVWNGKPRIGLEVDVRFSLAAWRYTNDYLDKRFHSSLPDGSPHPVGVLYDVTREKGPEAALAEYAKIRAEAPDRVDKNTLPDVAWFLMKTGMPDEAITVYQRSIEEFPEFWNTHMRMGDAYVISGYREKAVEVYTRMTEHKPDHPHLAELLKLLNR